MLPLPEVTALPWRPRSLASTAPVRMPLRRRAWVMVAIIAGHLGALFFVARSMAPEASDIVEEEITEVRFVTRPPPEPLPDPSPDIVLLMPPSTAENAAEEPLKPERRRKPSTRSTPTALIAIETPRNAAPLQLYDADGRVKLPDGLIDQLDAQSGDKRVFDYQVPGLATSGTFFDRPPPLTYEHNRFEKYYRPNQDLLTDLLTRMVEGTTKEVRIKIPGNPRAKIVCSVSLLALGGGCGVVQNQGKYVIEDDPTTLSAEEQAQCQAWWDKIVDAKSQAVWLKTRDLYEVECRKPLERKPPVPKGLAEPVPGRIKY
jgi:hypothetical protein